MHTSFIALLAGILWQPAAAEHLSAPLLGLVLEENTRLLWSISGIPGAATVSQPRDLGFVIKAAATTGPGRALALSADGRIFWIENQETGLKVTSIAATLAAADRVAFSPSGQTAVIWSSTAGRYQIVRGLGSVPDPLPETTSPIESVSRIAVSDDGEALFFASPSGELWQTTRGASFAVISPGAIRDAAFLPRSHGGIAVTASGALIRIESGSVTSSSPQLQPTAASVVALRATAKKALIGFSDGAILVSDLSGGTMDRLRCDCQLEAFHLLEDESLLRLNGLPQVVQLLDLNRMRTWFVPRDAGQIPNTPGGSDDERN